MHIKTKKLVLGGLLLALTILCMVLGTVIETNTLFLLAAASFFVGIVIREAGLSTGSAFYMAGVLLGLILAPNKLYVASYAAMGFYILAVEFAFCRLGKLSGDTKRRILFWIVKYAVFNFLYLLIIFGAGSLLFARELSKAAMVGVWIAGQAGLFIYDRAYEYFQGHIWEKLRKKIELYDGKS